MTVVNIRDELKELREIADVSTPQLCMAIREIAQRIEDAVLPADAPPFHPTFGDTARPEWRAANQRTKSHVSGCDCVDCRLVRGRQQCTCGESMAKYGDDLCRCKQPNAPEPESKS